MKPLYGLSVLALISAAVTAFMGHTELSVIATFLALGTFGWAMAGDRRA